MTACVNRSNLMYLAGTVVLMCLLITSCGPKTVKVPDVAGKGLDEATSILTKANLSLGSVSEAYHEMAPEGTVISQSVVPGEKVEEGTTINLTLSKGPQPEMVKVPPVVGMTEVEARQVLWSANLSPAP
jgi:beta-lactam-binding protein with PASTA domain